MNPIEPGMTLEELGLLSERGIVLDNEEQEVENTIFELLEEHRINISELARRTGLSRQLVNAVMIGKGKPGIDVALKIATVFGRKVEEIFRLTETAWLTPVRDKDNNALYLCTESQTIVTYKDRMQAIKDSGMYYREISTGARLDKGDLEKKMRDHVDRKVDGLQKELLANEPMLGHNGALSVANRMLKVSFMEDYEPLFRQLLQRIDH